jgi:nucleoid DNA-binding protein
MQNEEFIEKLSERWESSKAETEEKVEAIFELLREILGKKEELVIPGFGHFTFKRRGARKIKNPITRKEIQSSTKIYPVFRPAAKLLIKLNE